MWSLGRENTEIRLDMMAALVMQERFKDVVELSSLLMKKKRFTCWLQSWYSVITAPQIGISGMSSRLSFSGSWRRDPR